MKNSERDSIGVTSSSIASDKLKNSQIRPRLDVPLEDIELRLNELFDAYSKLFVSMHDWSVKDYFDQKIPHLGLKNLFFILSGLMYLPESKILEFDSSDRRFVIKRVCLFLDNVIEILEDWERCRPIELDEIKKIKDAVLQFKTRIPEPPKSVNPFQIAPLVSAGVAMLLLGLNLSGPNQNLYVNAIFSFGSIGLLLFALWLVISLGFIFRGFVWHKIMIRNFQVRKQELALLTALRPISRRISAWLYGGT